METAYIIRNGVIIGSPNTTETEKHIELTQYEYDALSDEEKVNGTEYRTYDTGHIYKLGVEYGKDAYFTSLSQLGLTAPTTVGEVFMAMPEKSMLMLNVEALVDDGTNALTVTDVPEEYGVLTIDKWSNSRFRIEFNISREGRSTNIKQWIGTLKGTDGTGLKWKEVATMDNLGEKADMDKVVPKITITDTTTADAKTVIEKNWSTIPAETSAATIVTSNYGYNALINKQGKYGTVMLTVPVSGESVYYGVLGGSSWTWKELATMDKVADVPNTVIVSEDTKVILNSSCYYTVINGVCYVSLWGFQCTEAGQYVVNSSMPKTRLTMKGLCTYGHNGYEGGCAFVFYDNNGNNKLYVEVKTANEPLYGSFSYPVAES